MNVETGKGAKQNIQGENIFGALFFLVYWILYTIEINQFLEIKLKVLVYKRNSLNMNAVTKITLF